MDVIKLIKTERNLYFYDVIINYKTYVYKIETNILTS